MLWDHQSDITIRNNIFYGSEQYAIIRYHASIEDCRIDHNLIYGASRVMMDDDGCSERANRIGSDPLFMNASQAPFDFRLRRGSPAIQAGADTSVPMDFEGHARGAGAPDIGAFAFTSSER